MDWWHCRLLGFVCTWLFDLVFPGVGVYSTVLYFLIVVFIGIGNVERCMICVFSNHVVCINIVVIIFQVKLLFIFQLVCSMSVLS